MFTQVVPTTVSFAGASLTNRVLLREWDDRSAQGLFRYDVSHCETKVTPGVYAFVLQLNEGRANKKRATEFSVDQVVQPYAHSKFNFTKAAMKEVRCATSSFPVRTACACIIQSKTLLDAGPNRGSNPNVLRSCRSLCSSVLPYLLKC